MNKNYEELYNQIVQGIVPPSYSTPEEQGDSIQKCTILQPIEEIEYSSYSRTVRNGSSN